MGEKNVTLKTFAPDDDAKSDVAAYLVYARAHFSTYDDNKDNTTRLEGFVNFFRGGPPILAAYMEQFNVEFPDPSQHDIPLRIENNTMYRRDIPGSHFLVRITVPPNGEDTWVFNVVINLVFSDASVYGASAGRVELDEEHNEIYLPFGTGA
jgi:hypothetical protein